MFSSDAKNYLIQLLSLEKPWTLIIDDALANSFVAPATEDIKDDHQLTSKMSITFFQTIEVSWFTFEISLHHFICTSALTLFTGYAYFHLLISCL